MTHPAYAVVIERAARNLAVFIPDAPGYVATGKDRETIVRRARELLGLWLHDLADESRPGPEPTPRERLDLEEVAEDHEIVYLEPLVPNPVSLELVRAVHERGITQTELARRLGIQRPAVSRLLNPWYFGHSLESLNRVARALDVRLLDSDRRAA